MFYTYSLFLIPLLYESNRRSKTLCEKCKTSEEHLSLSDIITKIREKAHETNCYHDPDMVWNFIKLVMVQKCACLFVCVRASCVV
jgi:hypothetical protein